MGNHSLPEGDITHGLGASGEIKLAFGIAIAKGLAKSIKSLPSAP